MAAHNIERLGKALQHNDVAVDARESWEIAAKLKNAGFPVRVMRHPANPAQRILFLQADA